jgi:hypothetical protein
LEGGWEEGGEKVEEMRGVEGGGGGEKELEGGVWRRIRVVAGGGDRILRKRKVETREKDWLCCAASSFRGEIWWNGE